MLDFFSIFGKGGIVLWAFQGTSQIFTSSVNALIKAVILQVVLLSSFNSPYGIIGFFKINNRKELANCHTTTKI